MRPLTARIIYSLCLCALAACAVVPPQGAAAGAQATAPQPSGIAVELATAMRRHAEAVLTYGPAHAEVVKVTATETSLRDTGSMADPQAFEYNLIQALAYELANARRDHTVLSGRYGGGHPEAIKADAVVWALTTAINAEVRRAKSAI